MDTLIYRRLNLGHTHIQKTLILRHDVHPTRTVRTRVPSQGGSDAGPSQGGSDAVRHKAVRTRVRHKAVRTVSRHKAVRTRARPNNSVDGTTVY